MLETTARAAICTLLLLAISAIGAGNAAAGCDDCYGSHDAYEREYEREYQREMAEEYGYTEHRGGRAEREPRRRQTQQQAKAQPKRTLDAKQASPGTRANSEHSSIATTDGSRTTTRSSDRIADVRDLGCKSFFPSVGMTLSVPCE